MSNQILKKLSKIKLLTGQAQWDTLYINQVGFKKKKKFLFLHRKPQK